MAEFGDILREFRILNGYTIREAGRAAGISPNTLGGWERMIRQPSIENLKKLADLYKVDINALVGYDINGDDVTPTKKLSVISQKIYRDENLMNLFKTATKLNDENKKLLVEVAKALVKHKDMDSQYDKIL